MLTPLRGALLTKAGNSRRRQNLAALTLGALAALAFPPIHLLPALLLAIPGLLFLIDMAPNLRAAARLGWWFGFGLNLLGLYWITEAILIEAARYWWLVPLAVPALSAYMAIFVALPAVVAKKLGPGWGRIFGLACAWTLADIGRQFILSGFPWNPWGSVWAIPGALGDIMIQPASLIGVHGLSLVTLLLAGLPERGRSALPGWLLLAVVWSGFGFWRLQQPAPAAPGPSVVVVQGNIAQGQKWDRNRALQIFAHYLRLTSGAVAKTGNTPLVVVWPETASPFPLAGDANARQAMSGAAANQTVLAGSVRWGPDRRPRNSLIALSPAGRISGVYDKWHLVPFGEVDPWWSPLPIQIVPGGGFAAGSGPRTLQMQGVPPFAPLICYEAIFGGEIVDRASRPAWLVNITNDAWFGQSTGPYQHLAAARLRAVEEGLPLVRAANTGISIVYDGFGRELGRLGLGISGTVTLPLPGALPPTIFARLGLGSTLLAISMMAVIGTFLSHYIKKRDILPFFGVHQHF